MPDKKEAYSTLINSEYIMLTIGQYNITASFSKQKNKDAYDKVRQILLSSYSSNAIARIYDKLDTRAKT